MSGLEYYLTDFITHRGEKSKIGKGINDCIYYSFQVIKGTIKYNPTNVSNRILLFSLRFLCVLIVFAFTANLIIFLLDLDKINEININIFEDFIHNNYRMCV